MKCTKLFLAALACLALNTAQAHEGHDSPGALPPPPNGGKVAEASHSTAHKGGAEERELFAEAKLEGSKLKLFAMGLDPTNTKVWQALVPSDKLSVAEAKIEFPRAKKAVPLNLKATAMGWEADLGSIKEHRLIVNATFMDNGEKKQTKIQLEK